MASRRKRKPPANRSQPKPARSANRVQVRPAARPGEWVLVHPHCALERQEDLEEVEKMIAAGELEVAEDELRWLLGGCSDFIDAHRTLAQIALTRNDLALARGHFGVAVRLGLDALARAKAAGQLPYVIHANRSFHEAGKGLVECLFRLGKSSIAEEVLNRLLGLDPTDPLGLRTLADALRHAPFTAAPCGAAEPTESEAEAEPQPGSADVD